MPTPESAARRRDTLAAIALLAAVAAAMLLANSPLGANYHQLLMKPLAIGVAPLVLTKSVLHWINDGLMAVFFLLVGLEIKREALAGELASRSRAILPAIGALGGMVIPALVYLWCDRRTPNSMGGWPIPTATDIAFALGVLALVGSRVPAPLRIFLLALAVIDDLGAIVLIAILFTDKLSWVALLMATLCLAALVVLNRARVKHAWPYVLAGFLLWLAVLKSGVHATLAGVALGLAMPLQRAHAVHAAERFEHGLHPWVTFGILPLFALANAGVPIERIDAATLLHPVTLGIALGLLVGKFTGVLTFTWLAVRSGLGSLPQGVRWSHLSGVALLTGIGFTMSLFLGALAFPQENLQGPVRLGVLLGSGCAAIAGALWLRLAPVQAVESAQGPIPR